MAQLETSLPQRVQRRRRQHGVPRVRLLRTDSRAVPRRDQRAEAVPSRMVSMKCVCALRGRPASVRRLYNEVVDKLLEYVIANLQTLTPFHLLLVLMLSVLVCSGMFVVLRWISRAA